MDPLTEFLKLANTIAQIVLLNQQAETPEQRAVQATQAFEFWQGVIAGMKQLAPKP